MALPSVGAFAWPAASTPLMPSRASVLISPLSCVSLQTSPQLPLLSPAEPPPKAVGTALCTGFSLPPITPPSWGSLVLGPSCPTRCPMILPPSPFGTTATPRLRSPHSKPWCPVRPCPHSLQAHPGPVQQGLSGCPTPAHFSQAPSSFLVRGLECYVHHPRMQPGPLGFPPGSHGVHMPPRGVTQLGGTFPACGDQGGSWRAVLTGRGWSSRSLRDAGSVSQGDTRMSGAHKSLGAFSIPASLPPSPQAFGIGSYSRTLPLPPQSCIVAPVPGSGAEGGAAGTLCPPSCGALSYRWAHAPALLTCWPGCPKPLPLCDSQEPKPHSQVEEGC